MTSPWQHAPARIRDAQDRRLRELVALAWDHVPFYRRLWGEAGVGPGDIGGVDDLALLPTWSVSEQRASLAAAPPFGEHVVDDLGDDVALIISSGGTTGRQRLMPVTSDDRRRAAAMMADGMRLMGVGPSDVVQITWPLGTTLAAWAFTWAAEGVGATLLPASGGRNTPSERQLDYIIQAGTTVLACTATYASHLADVADELGIDAASTTVRLLMLSGETVSPTTRRQLGERWGADVSDLYGNSDLLSWPAVDCPDAIAGHGGIGKHVWEEHSILEILDGEERPAASGEYGNLTVTSWVWRSSPKIRYRTNDAASLTRGTCSCGRDGLFLSPIAGRYDDMMKIKGVNLWPLDIEAALKALDGGIREYAALAEGTASDEWLRVEIERDGNAPLPADAAEKLTRLLNVRTRVDAVAPGATADRTGAGVAAKVRRCHDLRSR